MPCDTKTRAGQSLDARKAEVRTAIQRLATELAAGRARVVIDKVTGAVAFAGTAVLQDARVTDACALRLTLATGSALARAAIAKAEQLAGRTISRQAMTAGIHSHDGGQTFHHGH